MQWQIVIIVDVLVDVEDASGWWLRSAMMKALTMGGREQSVRRQNFNTHVPSFCSYVRNLTSLPASCQKVANNKKLTTSRSAVAGLVGSLMGRGEIHSRSHLTGWSEHPLINSHTELLLLDCLFYCSFG